MKSLRITAAILALAAAAAAQVGTNYAFSQTTGTYSPITGGTILGTATTANTMDDVTYVVPLPFGFLFDGAVQNSLSVQTNGWIGFSGTALGNSYTPLSSTLVTPGIISAVGRDLQGGYLTTGDRLLGGFDITNVSNVGPLQVGDVLVGTGIVAGTTITAINGNTITVNTAFTANSTGTAITGYGPWSEVRYETLGTAPNQIFVVQWSGFRRFGTTLTTNKDVTFNFQIRLHEATGKIEAVYGNCNSGTGTTTTALHHVGLRGPNNTFPANINNRANVKGVNDDWLNSNAGTTNAQGMLFNAAAPANVIPNGLTYSWDLPSGVPATNVTYGAGCYNLPRASFYQQFADAALASAALTGQSMTLSPVGGEYLALWGGGTYVAPSGNAAVLAVGDDGEVTQALSTAFPAPTGSTTDLRVHGNGIITLGSTAQTFPGTNNYTPTAAGFLAAGQTAFWSWHDYNASEAGSGAVKYEEALDGNNDLIAYITWDGVESYSTPTAANPSTLQFQLTLTGSNAGRATIVWQSIDADTTSTFGSGHLVGYSPGGANLDPGSVTLATALPIVTAPDVAALALSAAPTPVLGAAVTYTTSNIPASAVVSFEMISLGQVNPGVDLGYLGAPGCLQLVDLNTVATSLLFGNPSATFVLNVPTDPAFAGLPLNVQSASLVPSANAVGLITSNGVRSTIGNY